MIDVDHQERKGTQHVYARVPLRRDCRDHQISLKLHSRTNPAPPRYCFADEGKVRIQPKAARIASAWINFGPCRKYFVLKPAKRGNTMQKHDDGKEGGIPLEAPELLVEEAFAYRLYPAEDPGGRTLVLLHGSGVDETTLVPLARQIGPDDALMAVRGRVPQEGGMRWFARITPTRFDQKSIRSEAADFADFIAEMSFAERLDLSRTVFLGYSNGANLISSAMLLHPGLIRQAILLRAMPVLDETPVTNLAGTRILVIGGAADETYGQYTPALADLLESQGAAVEAQTVPLGHEFGAEDAAIARRWLGERDAHRAGTASPKP
ncbi:alpha/beta hydrolase [Mesorhizobium sp. BE184]|uniref:alpha/beta hydrolase n=1 Tax=Mesorhizobium sp. BE184 TaxID=2817714 RepID=UPI002854925C|nr:alpha/beta hydrolase [Mesorhizobium sp. BE184]MDR7032797.1 phospholipase/carboxylesterase [Mesorhizobium sp. BE184]